ncbi:hypothetical protein, partial [Paraburkholderia sacchari]
MRVQSIRSTNLGNLPSSNQDKGGVKPRASGVTHSPGSMTFIRHNDGTISSVWRDPNGNITHTNLTDRNGKELGSADFSPTTGKWTAINYNATGSGGNASASGGQVAGGNGAANTHAANAVPSGNVAQPDSASAPAAGQFTPSFGNSHGSLDFSTPPSRSIQHNDGS